MIFSDDRLDTSSVRVPEREQFQGAGEADAPVRARHGGEAELALLGGV